MKAPTRSRYGKFSPYSPFYRIVSTTFTIKTVRPQRKAALAITITIGTLLNLFSHFERSLTSSNLPSGILVTVLIIFRKGLGAYDSSMTFDSSCVAISSSLSIMSSFIASSGTITGGKTSFNGSVLSPF